MSKRRSILIEDLSKPGQPWEDLDSEEDGEANDDVNPMEALLKAEQQALQRSSLRRHSDNLTSSYDLLPETESMEKADMEEKKDEASLMSSLKQSAAKQTAEPSAPSRTHSLRRQESNLIKPHREFELTRSNSGLDIVKISKVERSWLAITENNRRIGEVGEKIFFRMFADYPDLIQLFPFGNDDIDATTGKLKINKRTRMHVRAHASAVLRAIGSAVAGKISVEELVPRLRNVGATHKMVGVQSMHYTILYRHLVTVLREEVGPEIWDQDTEDAWDQAFISITDLIKRPSKRLETEPLMGWGSVMLASCIYFTLVTPFRFGGFYIGHPNMIWVLDCLDFVCAMVMLLDLLIDTVQTKFRVSRNRFIDSGDSDSESEDGSVRKRRPPSLSFTQQSSLIAGKFVSKHRKTIFRTLTKYQMDRWVPWPSLDAKVLLSFVLQGLFVHSSLCTRLGLHWTQFFGLMRISCASRVLHFVQCAENNSLLRQKLDSERQLTLRIGKLLVQLAFITHVCACLYCAIARLEIGYDATEFPPSSFFPDVEILYGPNKNDFTSYSRALHWAFVSLSGIGNCESVPSSSLECWFTLIVHMIGAVFYAIVTGLVISTLEEAAAKDNKTGSEIAKLSKYLTTARMSKSAKERIMKGYMMRNVLTEADTIDVDARIESLGTLPNYLKMEVAIYARAEMIHRREALFLHCSNVFLVALSSSLPRTRTLISGDYLMKENEPFVRDFYVIEKGTLQIQQRNHTIKTLERGNCIGKAWLLQLKNDSQSTLYTVTIPTGCYQTARPLALFVRWDLVS